MPLDANVYWSQKFTGREKKPFVLTLLLSLCTNYFRQRCRSFGGYRDFMGEQGHHQVALQEDQCE